MTESSQEAASEERANVLVLKDGDGNYYAFSGRQLAEHRVPDDKKGQFEGLMSSAEVVGFHLPGLTPAVILPTGLGIAASFSAPVVELPSLQMALRQMTGTPTVRTF